jgi:hypothetical protein
MTRLREMPDFWELKRGIYYSEINLRFLILSCLIFQSSVEREIPSFEAATFGPATFPLHSTNPRPAYQKEIAIAAREKELNGCGKL